MRRTEGEGISGENQTYFHQLLFAWRERAVKTQRKHKRLDRKYNALKRTLHLIIDTCIIQSNEIADCKGEIKKLKLKLQSK